MLSYSVLCCSAFFLFIVAMPTKLSNITVIPGKADIQTRVVTAKNATIIDIHSTSGIGNAKITLGSGKRPERILLHLYLKGLEECNFKYGDMKVLASVSSDATHRVTESLFREENKKESEQPITARSPYWMPITMVAADATKTPPSEGYFEVEAPIDFLTSGAQEFTIGWIDFYR